MTRNFAQKKLTELFTVKSGDYHANSELDFGKIPLVSCGDTNNGVVGFYDVPKEYIYRNAITVAYNGQPLTTKFHPYSFGAKDDVAVLIPHAPLRDTTLLYIAVLLNSLQWRYSYGRKCYREKLSNVFITIPVIEKDGEQIIDEVAMAAYCPSEYSIFIPEWLRNLISQPK